MIERLLTQRLFLQLVRKIGVPRLYHVGQWLKQLTLYLIQCLRVSQHLFPNKSPLNRHRAHQHTKSRLQALNYFQNETCIVTHGIQSPGQPDVYRMLADFCVKAAPEFLLVEGGSEDGNSNVVLVLFELLEEVGVDDEAGGGVMELEGMPDGFHFAVLVGSDGELRQFFIGHGVAGELEVVIQRCKCGCFVSGEVTE